jgi:DNA-binding LacI/PurR family transcriptional regulator
VSKRRTTADDVARVAGVSRSAVSRAFTPGASVSEDTRQRVRQAATQLGYAPNAIARMLIKRQNNLIGVVMSDPTNTFLSHLLTRLLDRLQGAGYFPLLFRVSQREDFDTVLPTVLQYQVGAIFVTGSTPNPQVAALCLNAGTPVCVLNRWVTGEYPGHVISCDHELGGRLAADELVRAGHRRIALVTSVGELSTHQARVRGFTRRLQELGQTLAGFEDGAPTHDSGFASAMRLLSSSARPDALFCTSDMLAFGALDAARKLGLVVPADLGVLGFDDVEMAAWPGYDLSTIHQPVHAVVESALSFVGHSPATTPPSKVLVPPHFVARGTTLQKR